MKIGALLAGAVSGQTIQVDIAGFELLHKFSPKTVADVVEG